MKHAPAMLLLLAVFVSSFILHPSSFSGAASAQTSETTLIAGTSFAADATLYYPDGLGSLDSAWLDDQHNGLYIESIALYVKGDSIANFVAADCSLKIEVCYNDGYDSLWTLASDSSTIVVDPSLVLWVGAPSDTTWIFEVPVMAHKRRRYKVRTYDEIKLYVREEVVYRQSKEW